MYGNDRPWDNPLNWSIRAGRLFGIVIRVHVVFILCAIILVWMEVRTEDGFDWSVQNLIRALGTYAILFGIVLLHEFGHCFGARYVKGTADEILIWPLGGLAYVRPPQTPAAHMITTLAGPLVNVAICAICSGALVFWMGSFGAVPWNPLHPFEPVDGSLFPTTGQVWLLRVYGLSYFLLLVNLLPIFPFDGGRVLQAWLWSRKGFVRSMEIATTTGMIGAVLVGIFGLFVQASWLVLMIAIFGYLTCWQTRRLLKEQGKIALDGYESEYAGSPYGEEYGGFGVSHPYETQEPERRPSWWQRRKQRRTARKVRRERERVIAHEQAVEDILKKVSLEGISSLTSRERSVLQRETERKRAAGPPEL
ncbi:MAG: site-2 protease family protein [Phycisphaerae bacterium]|nr:site-2 protease family protein [Phycisphaerae bacterium]